MKKVAGLFAVVLFVVILSACSGEVLLYEGEDVSDIVMPPPTYAATVVEPITYLPTEPEPLANIPSWEVALEEFLSEFLPIFTQCTANEADWLPWEVGGWRNFVHEYERGVFYIADPVTGTRIYDAPYILALQFAQEYSTYIATNFYLHDIDNNGIPVLLIRWRPLGGHFEGISMLRYTNGEYIPVDISIRHVWNLDEVVDSHFLFRTAIFSGGSYILVKDSEDRTLVLGTGGAGGFGAWAYMLHMESGNVALKPIFNIRIELALGGGITLDLFVDESITGTRESLPDIEPEDALFIPEEWFHGSNNDATPVPIPIMPSVTVAPFPRMIDIEQRLNERIISRLIDDGRILP